MALAYFRRHRKYFNILMFAAVISMVFFGVWWSMREKFAKWFDSGGKEVVAHINHRKVTQREFAEFVQGIRIAGQVNQLWFRTLSAKARSQEVSEQVYMATIGQSVWPLLVRQLENPEAIDREHALAWLALYREARLLGFQTPEVAVERRLEYLREFGLTSRDIQATVSQHAYGHRDFLMQSLAYDMTLAVYIGYLLDSFGVPVEPELRKACALQDARIQVRMAVFEAGDAIGEVPAPAEDDLLEVYNKYKGVPAGQGLDGMGYRIPPKVAIEYLVAQPGGFHDEAAKAVTDSQIKAYYERNKDPEFLLEESTDDEKPEGADGGEEAEKERKDEKPEKQFRPLDEVRDEIRAMLADTEAAQLARAHLANLVGEITVKRKGLDLRIWADGERVEFVQVDDLLTADELAALEGIGGAARGRVTVPQAALSVVELVGPEKARIAVDEISEVYTGTAGRAYAFRVTDVAKSREPKGLDEVRKAVVKDVVRAKAFDLVREKAKRLFEAAAEKGLEAAAKEAGIEVVTSDWFPRERFIPYQGRFLMIPPTLPEVGSSPVAVAECYEMVEEGSERTLVTLPERKMVMVAELAGRKPPREKAYNQMRSLLAYRVSRQLAGGAVADLTDPSVIRRRMTVVDEIRDEIPPQQSGAGEPEVPEGSAAPEAEPSGDTSDATAEPAAEGE